MSCAPCVRVSEVEGVVEGLLDPRPADVVLLGAREGGEGDPVDAGGEEALTSCGAEEVGALAGRQAEGLGQGVDGSGVLGVAGSGWRRWRRRLGRAGCPSRSAASWVTTVSPAQCLRADLAMRKRNSAPDGSDIKQPGLVDDHQPAAALRGVGDPPPDGVEGEQRPGGLQLAGQVAQARTRRGGRRGGWWSARRTAPGACR